MNESAFREWVISRPTGSLDPQPSIDAAQQVRKLQRRCIIFRDVRLDTMKESTSRAIGARDVSVSVYPSCLKDPLN